MCLIDELKIIEIFCEIDDFCLAFEKYIRSKSLSSFTFFNHLPGKSRQLYGSEVLTILVIYHRSGMKCFKYYYEQSVLKGNLGCYFPKAVSYSHFLELISESRGLLQLFLMYKCGQSQRSNHYYIDSKKLTVCHNKRIHQHKVFKDTARRSKSSMGWFYGFKIHLVINHLGELVSFAFTAGNVSDNNKELLTCLLNDLKGKCYGDKGYLTQLFQGFYENGLHIVTKARKNMKGKIMPLQDKIYLRKRGVIESVNAVLMTVLDLEHTRHRKPENAFAHMTAALVAYCFLDKKPSIEISNKFKIAA